MTVLAPAVPRRIHVGRILLTVLAGLLFAAGWAAGKTVAAAAGGAVWCAVAVRLGWRAARRPRSG